MQVINYSKGREKLASLIDDVVNNHETIIITKNNDSAVLISLEEYNSWKETSYLMQSKNNAQRLMSSIEDVENNKLIKGNLQDND